MGNVYNMVGGGGGIKLVSFAVTSPPTKTRYLSGESFDPAGMVVTATYSNGASWPPRATPWSRAGLYWTA